MNHSSDEDAFPMEYTDSEKSFPSSLLTFAAVMTFLIMVVGILGNFLTILALVKCPKVRNVAAAFIISLCLADLIFCLLVLPFNALRFIHGTWTHGDFLCKLIPFIQYGNIGVSLLCIAMITINRYVMIAHHNSYGKIYKRHWIAAMIALCWLFSYGMQLPTLFGVWGTFGYDAKLGTCSIMNDKYGNSSKTSLFIIAFVIPCLIIIACYAKIFWVVHESEVRLKRHAKKQNSIPNNLRPTTTANSDNAHSQISSNIASDSSYSMKQEVITQTQLTTQRPSRMKDHREVRAKRNEWRITKMVLAIFLSFVICYLPITIVKVADKNVKSPGLHIFSYIMLYLSACINPIIYVIMNKQYRKAYKTVIMCEPSRFLPFVGKNGGGGSSIGEKWKDAGLSNNHSRTMVSSIHDQRNTSLSSSQSQPSIALEMKTKPIVITHFATTNKVEFMQSQVPKQQQILPIVEEQVNSNSNSTTNNNKSNNNASESSPKQQSTKEPNRIALAGGDIILEEEEEGVTLDQTVHPTETQSTVSPSENLCVNVGAQKKNPYYGQNINDIPDSTIKLMTKFKI